MRVPSRRPGQPGSSVVADDPGTAPRAPAPRPDLDAYRTAVTELVVEVGALADEHSTTARQALLTDRLGEPALADVLAATPQGVVGARETLLLELARHRPNPGSAVDLTTLVRSYLLSRIDVLWWPTASTYPTDDHVRRDADLVDLVDLDRLRRRGLLRFRYRRQPGTLLGRAVRAVRRRVGAHRSPHTAGLRLHHARPEPVALLNQIAAEFALAAPADTPPLWVTSLTRSLEHQYQLRRLGHPTVPPSSHCLGWAADVEMHWFRRYGAAEALATVLRGRQDAGEITVVDEGPAWHLCVAPDAVPQLRQAYRTELGE
ncbi:hypothetical protein GA0074692_1754 [Micromonospora pallida]|uniref:Uncharacterized protein n=1 Tax=Micromonospora pallida TaxID=145854 RepID=A0A1C6S4J3_9ACTN|nr:DUF5715 family protein [Micromonospora pallida]SCL24370.1 hypothetical protein GA0074692_1754 [Micromonospora pallida]